MAIGLGERKFCIEINLALRHAPCGGVDKYIARSPTFQGRFTSLQIIQSAYSNPLRRGRFFSNYYFSLLLYLLFFFFWKHYFFIYYNCLGFSFLFLFFLFICFILFIYFFFFFLLLTIVLYSNLILYLQILVRC